MATRIPNYSQDRAQRERAKNAKADEKAERRAEKSARKKARNGTVALNDDPREKKI